MPIIFYEISRKKRGSLRRARNNQTTPFLHTRYNSAFNRIPLIALSCKIRKSKIYMHACVCTYTQMSGLMIMIIKMRIVKGCEKWCDDDLSSFRFSPLLTTLGYLLLIIIITIITTTTWHACDQQTGHRIYSFPVYKCNTRHYYLCTTIYYYSAPENEWGFVFFRCALPFGMICSCTFSPLIHFHFIYYSLFSPLYARVIVYVFRI